jgi:hypothetical protein
MPTALIRWMARRWPADRSGFANHISRIQSASAPNQRLQTSARTTTARNSSPTNRIMMVPIRGGECRNGMGSVLSGRMLCMDELSPPRELSVLVAAGARQVQRPGSQRPSSQRPGSQRLGAKQNRRTPLKAARRGIECRDRRAVSCCEGRPRRASTATRCRRSCVWISWRPG